MTEHRQHATAHVAHHGPADGTPAEPRAGPARQGEGDRDRHHRDPDPGIGRRQRDREQRQQSAHRECQHRRPRSLPRAGQVVRVDAELHIRVRAQRIVVGELLGHVECQVGSQSLLHVDVGELGQLVLRHLPQLPPFLVEERSLGVALSAHRHVLARGHAHRAGEQSRDAGDEDRLPVVGGTCNTDHQSRCRNDAVVGAEHSRAQPVEPGANAPVVWLVLVRSHRYAVVGHLDAHGVESTDLHRRSQARKGCADRAQFPRANESVNALASRRTGCRFPARRRKRERRRTDARPSTTGPGIRKCLPRVSVWS